MLSLCFFCLRNGCTAQSHADCWFSDHEESSGQQDQQGEKPQPKVFTDDEIANIVDTVIQDNDSDGDGYVEYFEFKRKQDQAKRQGQGNQ